MKYPLYQSTLCPKIWDGETMRTDVRESLLQIAKDVVKDLKDSNSLDIPLLDAVVVGSVANYNWSEYSDIDLHIITDFTKLDMSAEDAQIMLDALKSAWNNKHDIKIKGHDVELYIQDKGHETASAAEFSVISNKWLKKPEKEKPSFDKKLIKKKYAEYKKQIDALVKKHDENGLRNLLDKLYKYRQSGLDSGGELSEENIVFKVLRAMGHVDKLKDSISAIYDEKVSLTEGLKTPFEYPVHVTTKKNLQSILKKGLLPNSPELKLDQKDARGVYFFPDIATVVDSWDSWLEDRWDEDEELVCIFADISGLPTTNGAGYEIVVAAPVTPDRIKKWVDLDSLVSENKLIETERLDDGISSMDGKSIDWVPDEDEGEFCMVPTDDDGQKRVFSMRGIPVYAAYRVMPKGVSAMAHADDEDSKEMAKALVNIRTAVKHPDGKGKKIVSSLIDKSIERMMKDKKFNASGINVIIPLGSGSGLNKEVAERLKVAMPNAAVVEDFLKKDTWDNVQLSKHWYETIKRRKATGKPMDWFEDFEKRFARKKQLYSGQPFAIKQVGPTTREYFSMFYKTDDKNKPMAIDLLRGANVLLIDDTLEAGSTLVEAVRALKEFGINDIRAYIFLFGRGVQIAPATNN